MPYKFWSATINQARVYQKENIIPGSMKSMVPPAIIKVLRIVTQMYDFKIFKAILNELRMFVLSSFKRYIRAIFAANCTMVETIKSAMETRTPIITLPVTYSAPMIAEIQKPNTKGKNETTVRGTNLVL